ncbi:MULTISPECIES: hemerythrin domain-containing protein [Phenylobacterium]
MTATVSPSLAEAESLDDSALIRRILDYHSAHLRDLAAAAELAEEIASAHASAAFPERLPGELRDMLDELQEHQAREELALFPAILKGRGPRLLAPVSTMTSEHDDVQDRLERLVRLTEDFTPPAEASASWRRLYDLCRKFDQDFRTHIQFEERVLFPRVTESSFAAIK